MTKRTVLFLSYLKKISVEDAYRVGQRVMGQNGNTLGTLLLGSPEDKRLRGYFGVPAEVVEAWGGSGVM